MMRWRLTVACAAVLAWAGAGFAATTRFVATTGNDTENCGASSAPCETIQWAIDHSVDGDTVRVRNGTYHECIFVETGPASGAITLETEAFAANGTRDAVTLDGTGVCDAASGSPGPVVIIFDRSVLRGFKIQKGGDSGIWGFGAVAITNNTITQNSTSTFAGGIFAYTGAYVFYENTKMEIKSNTISSNTSVGSGGGLYLFAASVGLPSVVEVEDNIFRTNTAGPDLDPDPLTPGAFGSGMTVLTDTLSTTDESSVVITRNTIEGNVANNAASGYPAYGGGMFVATGIYLGYGTETVTVGEVGGGNSVRTNDSGGYGGGMSVNLQPGLGAAHTITVAGNAISANTAGRGGGGVHAFIYTADPDNGNLGILRVEDNAITGNDSESLVSSDNFGGGGIFAEIYSERTPGGQTIFEIQRNQIQLNDSQGFGGGASLFAYADDDPILNGVIIEAVAEIDFRNNLVTQNTAIDPTVNAGMGGGIFATARAFGDLALAKLDFDYLTVVGNQTEAGAGGIELGANPELDSLGGLGHIEVELTNSIIMDNEGFGAGGTIVPGGTVSVDIRYNDAFENIGGDWESNLGVTTGTNGNISVDPDLDNLFVPQLCSPTIDAGDPAAPFSAEPEPNGGRVNMGHLGGTSNATRTLPDATGDGVVDGIDILQLAIAFNATDPDVRYDPAVDFDANGTIDGLDLSYLAALYARSCP